MPPACAVREKILKPPLDRLTEHLRFPLDQHPIIRGPQAIPVPGISSLAAGELDFRSSKTSSRSSLAACLRFEVFRPPTKIDRLLTAR